MPKKATSPKAAKSASNVLRKKGSSADEKTAAGSALSQREPSRKPRARLKKATAKKTIPKTVKPKKAASKKVTKKNPKSPKGKRK